MCVGLVISCSNFSLARNLGRREFEVSANFTFTQTDAEILRLDLPAEVILFSEEAVVDVTNK